MQGDRNKWARYAAVAAIVVSGQVGCGDDAGSTVDMGPSPVVDASVDGAPRDAARSDLASDQSLADVGAGSSDAQTDAPSDGASDGSAGLDSAVTTDAVATSDAATSDAARADAATSDSATSDAAIGDAAIPDTFNADAGTKDAGTTDAIATDAIATDGASGDGPDTCAAIGGSCVGVGSCAPGSGHISNILCPQGGITVCCIPDGQCGGPENFICCQGIAGFRPWCKDGNLECLPGMTKSSTGTCP